MPRTSATRRVHVIAFHVRRDGTSALDKGGQARRQRLRQRFGYTRSAPPRRTVTMATMHLLVVEDEDAIAEPLVEGLAPEGFKVDARRDRAEALAARRADLVLLDLRLPDIDGFEVCRELRARSDVPIIVVTAKGEEVDRVVGLELGADDYVVKPFGLRELVARIRAVSRRSRPAAPTSASSSGRRARRSTCGRGVRRVDGRELQLTREGVRPARAAAARRRAPSSTGSAS